MWIPVFPGEVASSSISRMKSAPACNFNDSLPSAHSCLIPFRRPTTKSKPNAAWGMGGTIAGQGSTGSWRDISKNCLTCPPLKAGTIPAKFPSLHPRGVFWLFCILFWAISHSAFWMTLGLICSCLRTGPPNLRNNTSIIDSNMLETPKVSTHSQHGAGDFFFFFSANEHATPWEGRGAMMLIPLQQTFSPVNMHVPSVQSHQRYPVWWELLIPHPQ